MSLTSYRAAPPRGNRERGLTADAAYVAIEPADGKTGWPETVIMF